MAVQMLDWMHEPVPERGVSFYGDDAGWHEYSFPQLANGVRHVASCLIDAGVQCDGVVAIALPTGPQFVTAFFGALLAGGVPAPLVPPTLFLDHAGYVSHMSGLLAAAEPRAIMTTEDSRPLIERAVADANVQCQTIVASFSSDPCELASTPRQGRYGLLQFTSGSSGPPRGVLVTRENLETNIAMIQKMTEWEPDEPGSSWLPTYHDMGLIGCLLTPVTHARSLRLMRPDQFIRDPGAFLRTFGTGHRSVYTAAPNFGYAYVAKRVVPESLEGLDFSSWRAAIVGAERLDAAALGKFCALLEPFGFPRQALMPAYGLAEATLCVSSTPIRELPRVCKPEWSSLAFGEPVTLVDDAAIGDPKVADGAGWLMTCGRPLPPGRVTIVDEDDRELPERHLGEVVVHGPTVADGYLGGTSRGASRLSGDTLHTGDAGMLDGGELFVFGRLGDRVKVRGRMYYAEDLEGKITALPDVPKGRCIVTPASDEDRAGVIAMIEAEPGSWLPSVRAVLQRELGPDAVVRIVVGPQGTIARTSSGKPRRRLMWQRLVEGELTDEVTWDADLEGERVVS
jgi:fatty-acyl-CoA synthase